MKDGWGEEKKGGREVGSEGRMYIADSPCDSTVFS